MNSEKRYKFVSNVKANHARQRQQQPIFFTSHIFSSLLRDTQRSSVRLCFPDRNTTLLAGTVRNVVISTLNACTISTSKYLQLGKHQSRKMSKRRNGTKVVLHEMVEGLQELMDMDNSDAVDSP